MRRATTIGIIAMLFMASCQSGFEELQVNPNGPTAVNPDFLFTESVARAFEDDRIGINAHIWTLMVWTQMAADIAGVPQEGQEYVFGGSPNDETWSRFYTAILAPAQEVINLTQGSAQQVNKKAIARIWMIYNYQRITDLWGPVPYTEALRATDPLNPITQPAYDAQEDIYLDMMSWLKASESEIDPDKPGFGSADPLFDGDLDAWLRFSRSLRLRIATRMSNVSPAAAQTQIEELMADESLLISSNSESAAFPHIVGTTSPLHQLNESGQGFRRPSHYLIEKLISTNDPRLAVIAQETVSSTVLGTPPYVGVPNLLTSVEMSDEGFSDFNTSELGEWFVQETTPGAALLYSEVCFLKAEAAFKGWGGSGTAADYYEEGVRAAMTDLGLPIDSANAWLSANPFGFTLEEIIEQKWIALAFRDAFEAFAEQRRTGFPVLTDFDGQEIPMSDFPQRFPYTDLEQVVNGANVTAVGFGINDISTPMWWVP